MALLREGKKRLEIKELTTTEEEEKKKVLAIVSIKGG